MGKARTNQDFLLPSDDLFVNLAEQIMMPLVQIAHAAELMDGVTDRIMQEKSRSTIALTASSALHLIDSYLLGVALQREQQLELEPVSISSVLYDTAAILDRYARAYGCKLELQISGKYVPVMARRDAVQAALVSLGYSFIEALSATEENPILYLSARRNNGGIATGIYTEQVGISDELFKHAKYIKGKVRQPLARFDYTSGTGIFIADELFTQMDAPIRASRSHGLQGLAATLMPSRQLSLV